MPTSAANANSTMKHIGGDSPRTQEAMNVILILASAIVIVSIFLMAIQSPNIFTDLCCYLRIRPPAEEEGVDES